ncbi:MAG: tetratricopeptide repeat protein [Bacteroidia bacterium]|nr:tetratricopeptide repeat protein [Bacteroidia bacterium]MCZ2247231.1 tetratricopeptide repeat protein [Bacteroidia bacterium]
MKQPKTIQILVVFGLIVLTVLLFFTNKKGKPSKKESPKVEVQIIDLNRYSDSIVKALDQEQKARIETFKQFENKAETYDSIARIVATKSMGAAASFLEKKAEFVASAQAWKDAGMLYYRATHFEKPELLPTIFGKAQWCFSNALKLDASDLEAETMLGTCYVEEGSKAMEGVTILKNVVKKDSTFLEAQVQLGVFAIQSGQYEKALERFEKILKINPEYIQAYIYLGQIYADMGRKKEAIEVLRLYMKKSNDYTLNQQVEKFINELEKQ